MTDRPINWESASERNEWIIKNAQYFTAFRMLNRQRQRQEAPTIDEARAKAKIMLADDPKPVLIYAVNGLSDTFIEMIKGEYDA